MSAQSPGAASKGMFCAMRTRLDAPRVLVTGAALADGSGPTLRRGVSLLIEDGVLAGVWDDGERPAVGAVEEVDASGATVVDDVAYRAARSRGSA